MALSGLLEICESEPVKKSDCGLSCWLVLPAARKRRERMCALSYRSQPTTHKPNKNKTNKPLSKK